MGSLKLIILVVVGVVYLSLCSGEDHSELTKIIYKVPYINKIIISNLFAECGSHEHWRDDYEPGCESTCEKPIPPSDCNITVVPGCACNLLYLRNKEHHCVSLVKCYIS
ncbi:hypothetical protein ILUMI_09331 [Ignelater luminosus]|uniref:TIL domain-containing protein n=1 Tax=Ignelater luminosus TaxID=2038154 RepID=A0A8K0D588_IGNLU|nr:hypothetical protein ILUMI_09331 [Ignelater luminosus]